MTVLYLVSDASKVDVEAVVAGLKAQLQKEWTAFLLFESEPAETKRTILLDAVRGDVRIQLLFGPTPTLDAALQLSDYTILVDGEIILRRHALYMFGEAAARTKAALLYSDEEYITQSSQRRPLFKPRFSPELLRQTPYIGNCVAARSSLLKAVDVERLMANALTVAELARSLTTYISPSGVLHLPFVLYSVATARPQPLYSSPPVLWDAFPAISVIIPTRDNIFLLKPCLDSLLEKTRYPRCKLQVVVIDNGSKETATLEYFESIRRENDVLVIRDGRPFNFSALNNAAVGAANGEVILFLNNDTIVNDDEWLRKLAAYAVQRDVGAVGCKLLYPDLTIQHGGTYTGIRGVAAHAMVGKSDYDGFMPGDYNREMSCVTGACLAMRREVFNEVGGFDPVLAVAFNDVSLCLKTLRRGYRNIYVRDPLLIHFESKSRGSDDTTAKADLFSRELVYVRRQFNAALKDDAYYSPNLSLHDLEELAFPPRAAKPWVLAKVGQGRIRVLILSSTHEVGQGIPLVIQQHAMSLTERGIEVVVGGPKGEMEITYENCSRAYLNTSEAAANYVVRNDVHCIIVETPPFFSVVRHLGEWPKCIFIDHGEPPPDLFYDADVRRGVISEKRFFSAMADHLFAVSDAVRAQSMDIRTTILPNGNSHLASWTDVCLPKRAAFRRRLDWEDKVVVLNVCRFSAAERHLKGVDRYVDLRQELHFIRPELAKKMVFVLCGRSAPDDVKAMEGSGLTIFSNVSDAELIELYCAADLFMNLSRWEGHNLGIGQALAMGLPVIASDIAAHRAFGVVTANECLSLIEALSSTIVEIEGKAIADRQSTIKAWPLVLQGLETVIRQLCAA